MTTSNVNIEKLAENVQTLQQDMASVGALVERLDVTIEKLTEVASNVSQLLAVHGSKLEFQEKFVEKLQEAMEKRRIDSETNFKDVYTRIEKVESGLQDDLENNYTKIVDEIREMQKDAIKRHEEISEKHEISHKHLKDRIAGLERWIWLAMGGGIVVVWLAENIGSKLL